MKLLLPAIAGFAVYAGNILWHRKNHYTNDGNYRMEKAQENGDVTRGELCEKSFFNSSLNSYENQDVWRAKYRYEVDGKTYYCKLEYTSRPPLVIDVYYDRTRGNKRIEPGKYSILDYVRNVLPLIALALVFLLVNFF